DRAVDVHDVTARPADQVVVVVPDPGFVTNHRACRVDASHEAGVGEHTQGVVHGLVGDGRQVDPGRPDQGVGVGVRSLVHGVQHGEPGPGDPEVCSAQQLLERVGGGHV